MTRARTGVRGGEGGVDRGPELSGNLGVGDPLEGGIELGLQTALGLIDELAHDGALLLGHGAQLLHQGGEFTVRTDVTGLGGLEFGAIPEGSELGRGLGEQGGEGVLHGGK